MDVTSKGRAALTVLEGKREKVYLDSVGIATGGVGHTAAAGPPIPKLGDVWSDSQIDQVLTNDLANIYEPAVERNVRVTLNAHEFDGVVLWTFNIGEGNLRNSTALKLLNAGDRQGFADQLPKWNKAGGRTLAGLTRRRAIEAKIFSLGVYPTDVNATVGDTSTADLPVLMLNSRYTEDVKSVQSQLAGLLFYKGRLDGLFGTKTELAVQAFQRAYGLDPDGRAGYKTRTALDRATRNLTLAGTIAPPAAPVVLKPASVGKTETGPLTAGMIEAIKDATGNVKAAQTSSDATSKSAETILSAVKDAIKTTAADPAVPGLDRVAGTSVANSVLDQIGPLVKNLTNGEPWYQSRVILGVGASIILGVGALVFKISPTDVDQKQLVDLIAQLGTVATAAYALYGRLVKKPPLNIGPSK